MPSRDFCQRVGEYDIVLRAAEREGWLAPLVRAHATAATVNRARTLLMASSYPMKVRFRDGRCRGRATWSRHRKTYLVTLPSTSGTRSGWLREGIVLHELAHIPQHICAGRFGHGVSFTDQLRPLVLTWKGSGMVPEREVYDRHPGPYSLIITSTQGVGSTELVPNAQRAHERAVELVGTSAQEVLVFSEEEKQYVGLAYERGRRYGAWDDPGGLDVAPGGPDPALLSGSPEPVREVASAATEPAAPEKRARARVARVPAVRGARLRPAGDGIPEGASDDEVKVLALTVAQGPRTVKEIVDALTGKTKCAVVASLVSRMKQRGVLVEVRGE